MKVVYDMTVLGLGHHRPQHRAGIFRVIESIARGLAAAPECEVSFYASPALRQECVDYLESSAGLRGIALPHSAFRRSIYLTLSAVIAGAARAVPSLSRLQELGVSSKLAGAFEATDVRSLSGADLFHSPFHPLPSRSRWPRGVQRFLTVYDLIPILYPQFCEPHLRRLSGEILDSVDDETWVLTISEATRDDLCRHRGLDPSRIFVTYPAADPHLFYRCRDAERIAATRCRLQIPEGPYLLGLSTFEPRKNLDHVVRCFARLAEQEGMEELRLVLAGSKGWYYDRIFDEIGVHASLRDRILVTGRVPDEDLAPLYSGALAFVYLSLYEGFGLPVLEAMQCGVPVITSRTSSLPEVVGDAGVMLDPADTDALCQAMLDMYQRPALRKSLAARSLERSRCFTWDRCVQETRAAYRTAIGEPGFRSGIRTTVGAGAP